MTDDEAELMGLACALERYMCDYYDGEGVQYERFAGLSMMRHVAGELRRYGWLKDAPKSVDPMKAAAARARMAADVKRGVETPDWIRRLAEQ